MEIMQKGLAKRVNIVKHTPIIPERKLKKPTTVRIDKNTIVRTEYANVDTPEKKREFIDRFKLNAERSRKVYQ